MIALAVVAVGLAVMAIEAAATVGYLWLADRIAR